ncbi:MAG TPA: hypothetical protein DCM26_02600 [Desulfotomaculum sp.]|jgi:uncharacterized protein YuzE|nr:hypothetical protein [Desulfotomaculum sp.]
MFGPKAKDKPVLNYDREHDVLYISLGRPAPSYSDEDGVRGVLIRRAIGTGEITGATIIDYSKRDKKQLQKVLPFRVNQKEVNL